MSVLKSVIRTDVDLIDSVPLSLSGFFFLQIRNMS